VTTNSSEKERTSRAKTSYFLILGSQGLGQVIGCLCAAASGRATFRRLHARLLARVLANNQDLNEVFNWKLSSL
jgi:hypothetical protein